MAEYILRSLNLIVYYGNLFESKVFRRLMKSDSEVVGKVCAGWSKQLKHAWKNLFEGGNRYAYTLDFYLQTKRNFT